MIYFTETDRDARLNTPECGWPTARCNSHSYHALTHISKHGSLAIKGPFRTLQHTLQIRCEVQGDNYDYIRHLYFYLYDTNICMKANCMRNVGRRNWSKKGKENKCSSIQRNKPNIVKIKKIVAYFHLFINKIIHCSVYLLTYQRTFTKWKRNKQNSDYNVVSVTYILGKFCGNTGSEAQNIYENK